MKIFGLIVGLIALGAVVATLLYDGDLEACTLEKGVSTLASKDFDEAEQCFTYLIDGKMNSVPNVKLMMLTFRAKAYSGNKKFELALNDLNKATEIAPEGSKPRMIAHRGLVHMKNNNLEDAIQDFNFSIKSSPDLAVDAYVGRAELYARKSNFRGAVKDLKRVIETKAASERMLALIYYTLGTYQEKIGDIKNAISSYDRADQLGNKSEELNEKLRQYRKP